VFFVLEVPPNGPQLQTFGVHFFVLKVLQDGPATSNLWYASFSDTASIPVLRS